MEDLLKTITVTWMAGFAAWLFVDHDIDLDKEYGIPASEIPTYLQARAEAYVTLLIGEGTPAAPVLG